MERIITYAKERGFAHLTPPLHDVWRLSVSRLTRALVDTMVRDDGAPQAYAPDGTLPDAPLEAFGAAEARLHRARGLTLPMFLGLLKYYRKAYLFLMEREMAGDEGTAARNDLAYYFDRLELVICREWTEVGATGLEELRERNRAIINEKNKYLALFESLGRPVMLLDPQGRMENCNLAASIFFGLGSIPGGMYSSGLGGQGEDRSLVAIETVAPWLAGPIRLFVAKGMSVHRFEQALPHKGEECVFDVTLASMVDVSGQLSGVTVVLDDMTERKRAERRIRLEKQRAEQYLDLAGSILVALDLSGKVLLMNREGCEVLGYAERDIVGRNWIDVVVPPDQRASVRDIFSRVVAGDVGAMPETAEHEVLTRTGGRRIISWKNRILTGEDGRVTSALSSGRDVTHQRRAEEALRERDEQYRALFHNEHAVMLLLDPVTGAIVDVNPAACHFYGYPVETMRSMRIQEINTLSPEEVAQELRRADTGQRNHFNFRHRLANGEVRDVEVYSGPINVRGKTLLYSVVHDVTARIRVERERSRIYDLSADLLCVYGMDGVLREVNPSWGKILGWTTGELHHKHLFEFVHPEDRGEVRRMHERLRNGEAVLGFEIKMVCKNNSYRWVSWNAMPDQQTGLVYAVGRDVTSRREGDDALRESETRYRSLFEESPIALWEEDFSRIKLRIDELRAEGVADLAAYFASHPEAVEYCLRLRRIVDLNQAAVELLHAQDKTRLEFGPDRSFTDVTYADAAQALVTLAQGRTKARVESELCDTQGNVRKVDMIVTVAPGFEDSWGRVMISIIDITERKQLEEKLTRLATMDSLTGACNRHRFLERAREELARARRYGRFFAVLMMDLDHFKKVNDTYGHQAGDEVLQYLAATCHATFRESDIFGRLGGEEFAAVLIETSLPAAMKVAERLRGAFAAHPVLTRGGPVSVTVSIGVACAWDDKAALEDILHRADEALYAAKREGRDRVVSFPSMSEASLDEEEHA